MYVYIYNRLPTEGTLFIHTVPSYTYTDVSNFYVTDSVINIQTSALYGEYYVNFLGDRPFQVHSSAVTFKAGLCEPTNSGHPSSHNHKRTDIRRHVALNF
jgi:hypothetical protein